MEDFLKTEKIKTCDKSKSPQVLTT